MSSTWISMPIENAKETVQRYIDRHSITTYIGLQGKTVTYEADCEVFFDINDLATTGYDINYFYFGYIYFPVDTTVQETTLNLTINDGASVRTDVINCALFGMSQSFAPIMFNEIFTGPTTYVTFIGYKFKLV